jgi:hypothetical protein
MGFPVRTGPKYLANTSFTCSYDHKWSKNENLRGHHFSNFPLSGATVRCRLGDPRWRLGDSRWRLGDPKWRLGDPRWHLGDPTGRLGDPRVGFSDPCEGCLSLIKIKRLKL